MPGPFRQSDAVLTIAQDNARHAIEISAANEAAGELVGFPPEELKGMAFRELLPLKIAEMLDDYVEYEAGANDVGDVLRKVRDFQLKNKNGAHLPLRVKIVRHHSQVHDEYMLIMNDEERQRENDAVMKVLHENFQGHASLDADTGLPDRASLEKGLQLVEMHRENIKNGVCVAVMQMDGYEELLGKHGVAACHRAMQAIAALCQQNLRGNDVVTYMDKNRLAIILVGAAKEPAKIVLNRLRWLIAGLNIRSEQGGDISTTVTVLFGEFTSATKADELLPHYEKILAEKPADSVNMVVEG